MSGISTTMRRRSAFLVAAIFSVVAAQAGANSTVSHRSLPAQIWGWELDAAGARTTDSARLVELRRRGINTIVLDGARVPSAQVARIRQLASGARMAVIVVPHQTSSVKALATHKKDVRVIVVRLTRLRMVRTVSDSASTRVLVLAPLRNGGRPFAASAWRTAIQTAVDDPHVDLAVAHAPSLWAPPALTFFHLLAARPARDHKAPSMPTGFASASTSNSIALSWRASRDNRHVRSYRVALGKRVVTVKNPKASFGGLACGTANSFQVRALDVAGNASRPSRYTASTSACTGGTGSGGDDVLPPSAPLGVAVQATGQASVTLGWTASTDNVGVKGYGVYDSSGPIATSTSLSYTFTGLACGTTYSFAVDAFDAAGNRSDRTSVAATTAACTAGGDKTPPSTPGSLRTTSITATTVAVAWNASTDNVGVTGYRARLNGTIVNSPTTTSYSFTGLVCGTNYTFSISAFDAQGNESPSASLPAATSACPSGGDQTPPSTPGNLAKSSSTGTTITVSWSASTDNVAVTGYTAYRNGASVASPSKSPYTYSGLTCGASYTLALDAVDAAGNRSPRAAITATTAACATGDTSPPSAPSALTALATTVSSITLSWTASTDNVGVTGYGVYRDGSSLGNAAATSYTFTGLSCGSSYTLAVDAFDAAGNRSTRPALNAATSACPVGGPTTNLTVSTAGSDSNPCTPAAPCASFDRAYRVATPGSTVEVVGGTYGSQRINTDASKSSPADVVFQPAPGASVKLAEINIDGADHITVSNMRVSRGVWVESVSSGAAPDDITISDVNCEQSDPVTGCKLFIKGASNVNVIRGSYGPYQATSTSVSSTIKSDGVNPARNILIDGTVFHDTTRDATGTHTECIWAEVQFFTLRNSRFYNCSIMDIFFTHFEGPETSHDVTMENNWFAPPGNASSSVDSGYYAVQISDHVGQVYNWTIRNNSFQGAINLDSTDTITGPVSFVGNLGRIGGCKGGVTYSYNVWSDQACSSTDRKLGNENFGWVNTGNPYSSWDLHLAAGSPAIDFIPSSVATPSVDIDGDLRPRGAGKDAGSDER